MAHYKPATGLDGITGALSKKKIQGVKKMTVTRRKRIKDPLTEAETRQRAKWKAACRLAPAIVRDTSHPRYMEFYRRWKEHVQTSETPMPFLNFVRAVLIREA